MATFRTLKTVAPTIDAKKKPSTAWIAWAAGVYEGEGYCWHKVVKNVSRGIWYTNKRYEASVTQKDRFILDRLRTYFGGAVRYYKKTKNTNAHFRWSLYGARARSFIKIVYKWLSPRRKKQAKGLL
jgi:hypothetical protein